MALLTQALLANQQLSQTFIVRVQNALEQVMVDRITLGWI